VVALVLIGLLFVFLGIAVLISGVVTAMRQSRQTARDSKVKGTVVGLERRVINPGSAGVYCPVVEFVTAAGQRVRFESEFGSMPPSHRVGQTVDVHYDPTDVDKAEVDSATTRWLAPGCMSAMGLLFVLLGSALFVAGVLVLIVSSRG
jgi:Protein of unknown function (DUF3592)